MLHENPNGRRDFRLLLVSTGLALGSYALLLPVVPLWAKTGGAGPAGTGASNASLFAATVLAQLGSPPVLRRLGHRETFIAGSVLLSAPAFGYHLTSALPTVITLSVVRGVGFALVIVTGGAFVARLLPANRRGRGLGLYGLANGLPSVVLVPVGPSISAHLGFGWLFVAGGVLPLLGAATAAFMRIRTRERPGATSAVSAIPAIAHREVPYRRIFVAPTLVMYIVSVGATVYITFLPTAIANAAAVTAGLLARGVGGLVGRWTVGELSDRQDRPALMMPGVVGCSVGIALTAGAAWTDTSSLVLAAAITGGLLFGLGFGAVQNATLAAMFSSVSTSVRGYDVASSVWNVGIDGGFASGSIGIGVGAEFAGLPVTFLSTALVLAATTPAAARVERRLSRPVHSRVGAPTTGSGTCPR